MGAAKVIAIEEEKGANVKWEKTNKRRRHEKKGKLNQGRIMRWRDDRQKGLNGRQEKGGRNDMTERV